MEPATETPVGLAGASCTSVHPRRPKIRRYARAAWNVDQVWLGHRISAHLERRPLPAVFHGEAERVLLSFERPPCGDPARQPPHDP
jgi:hypothetical protein